MTHKRSIGHHQRLLETYRTLLRAYLDQQALWQLSEVPDLVSTGIDTLRGEITQVKIILRDIGADVEDLAIDQPMSDRLPERIQHLKRELEQQHKRLGNLLLQKAALGGHFHTPPSIVEQIQLARTNIHRIKAALNDFGVSTQDFLDDVEL